MGKNFKLAFLIIYVVTGIAFYFATIPDAQAAEQSASAVDLEQTGLYTSLNKPIMQEPS